MIRPVGLLVLLIPLMISRPSAAEQPPGFALSWGGSGSGAGQFAGPEAVKCDALGNVYVSDRHNLRIQAFSNTGTFITQWGISGYPTAIAIDALGNIYVGQQGRDMISVWSPGGQFLRAWGSPGTDPGQFDYPSGIAINPAGDVFVSDLGNDRIQKFTSTGQFLKQWGGHGSGNGEFYNPNGIAAGSGGEIYIMDSANDRIQVFDSDGAFLTLWGTGGTGPGQFTYGIGLTIDNAENLYVADTEANRILKFGPNGEFLSSWGSFGIGDGYFDGPIDVATDAASNVFIADSGHDLIQKFDPLIAPPPPRPDYAAKLLLHLTQPVSKNACLNGALNRCEEATVGGSLSSPSGPFYYAYLLVARGWLSSIAGLQCGIAYEQNLPADVDNGHGVDVFAWTYCGDLEWRTPAGTPPGAPDWPGPGSGNLMTWSTVTRCQFGETAVAGYFYMAAYSPDVLRIIPRPADGKAAVVDCVPVAYDLAQGDLGFASFSANGNDPGCNPCLTNCEKPVAVFRTTWSGIKTLLH